MATGKKIRAHRPDHSAGSQAGEELPTAFAMQCNMRWGKRRLPVTISLGSKHSLLGLFELVPRSVAAEATCRSAPALVPGRVVSFEWCGVQFGARIAARSTYFGLCLCAADVLRAMMLAMPSDDASADQAGSAGHISLAR